LADCQTTQLDPVTNDEELGQGQKGQQGQVESSQSTESKYDRNSDQDILQRLQQLDHER
jgi:hypothetical protein